MKKSVVAIASVLLASQFVFAGEVADNKPKEENKNIGQTIVVDVKKQEWQVRRMEYLSAIKRLAANGSDKEALAIVDKTLTEYEKTPWSKTPMEAMDLLQTFYVPREGLKGMNMLVAEAILGYKDTLQWASPSGKSEILWNEQFLTRALTNWGKDKKRMDEWLKLVEDKPEEAKKIVADGVKFAKLINGFKGGYDRKWSTAYGLERMTAALENKPDKLKETPNMSDDEAINEAITKISAYYLPKSIISKEKK